MAGPLTCCGAFRVDCQRLIHVRFTYREIVVCHLDYAGKERRFFFDKDDEIGQPITSESVDTAPIPSGLVVVAEPPNIRLDGAHRTVVNGFQIGDITAWHPVIHLPT